MRFVAVRLIAVIIAAMMLVIPATTLRRFPLLAPVTVYRMRPWTPEDAAGMGEALLRQVYGDFLPEGAAELVAVRVAA